MDITRSDHIPLIDPFGRAITYLRVSVTDRCDLRCQYCMAEQMSFLPHRDLLTLEELDRLCSAFIARGTRKIRLTGGEPLVRRNLPWLLQRLARHLETGKLDELTLTTNGTQLTHFAAELATFGIKRINVSLDTLNHEKFRTITRIGDLRKVMQGIDAALTAGLKVKINCVAIRNFNDDEWFAMLNWAHGKGMDLTFIEVMPMGEIDALRSDQYVSLRQVRDHLSQRHTLTPSTHRTGGPSRYMDCVETGGRIGFITPMSHNFCESCNRVRLTCTGTLYMCLGQDDAVDLRTPLRSGVDDRALQQILDAAIARKPKGHDFDPARQNRPSVERHMSVTGG